MNRDVAFDATLTTRMPETKGQARLLAVCAFILVFPLGAASGLKPSHCSCRKAGTEGGQGFMAKC